MNLNKLDSAFDIDPLFHKMSKTFDEGGAKGLLLANLGVGSEGCNIVFDSSCEAVDLQQQTQKQKQQEATTDNDANADDNVNMDTGIDDMDTDNDNVVVATPPPPRQQEGMIDITTLKTKLDTLLTLTGQSVHSLQLVPQLSSLRDEHNVLDAAGFIITEDTGTANQDEKGRSNSSKNASASSSARNGKDGGRYAADQQEEKEADRSIHQEAMERSRASLGGRSFLSQATTAGTGGAGGGHDDDDDEYGNDDFGGGGYDDGDDDDDGDDGFDNFMAMDENGARFSSISFNDNNNNSFTSPDSVDDHNHKPSATSVLLDAITDGNVIYGATDYQYFDAAAFASVSAAGAATDNVWAGAWHWKRGARRRPTTKNVTAESARKSRTKKSAKERVFVDLRLSPDMSDILRQPPARKAKGDPLQIGKTTLAKHAKTDNLLPLDAGMGVEKLSSLFLRPNTVLKASSTTTSFQQSQVSNGKTVGFDMAVETWGNGPDDSFGGGGDDGDDDDGPGFCFAGKADDDGGDFCVDELHDVRKVDKVRVGHATVAKKVDVKRLKRDLWLELESCFAVSTDSNSKEQEQYSLMPDDDEEETEQVDASPPPADGEQAAPLCLSFHEAVQDLEAAKSQSDVTLPFYFICVLHLANEKGLRLDSKGLEDFDIYKEDATGMQLF
jgi:condensin complex subunit 2